MSLFQRREFLEHAAWLPAAMATVAASSRAVADEPVAAGKKGSANDKLRIACIGVHGQGKGHVNGYAGKHNCEVAVICDCDEAVIGSAMTSAEKAQGFAPKYVKDIRKLLEDKSIDAVSIATPNHWHALAAIWAMRAGKDVYVEKPVSHNVVEGQLMVEAARKYGRICQTGTQSRSQAGMRESIKYIHDGKIGKVSLAYGTCYKRRNSIGKVTAASATPKSCDYDLWSGPAPMVPLMRKNLHYDWHWVWATGNGDLGNQGIHEMDKARWGLNKMEFPRSVVSVGGRFGYVDDGETANTQLALFDYGDAHLMFEVRGLESETPYPEGMGEGRRGSNFVGNLWFGTDGVVVCPSYSSGVVFDKSGKKIKQFSGGGDHFGNFIKAVRSRKKEDLNADILEGHLSSALCHLANISYRCGEEMSFDKDIVSFSDCKEANEALTRMKKHLTDNKVDLAKAIGRVGPKLRIDPKSGEFISTLGKASELRSREYRKGFDVREAV
jgi:predicted dehydrogenase